MSVFKIITLVGAIILIAINIYNINFKNLSWKENKTFYLGIISMMFVILSVILTVKGY